MRATSKSLVLACALALAAAGCSGDPEPCEGVVCGENAHCNPDKNACTCDDGFSGDATKGCAHVVNCKAASCSGHGSCDDSSGNPVCTCEAGYTGSDCSQCADGYVETGLGYCIYDPCGADICSGHGLCSVDAAGNAVCACSPGYAGDRCAGCDEGYVLLDGACVTDPCAEETCSGHGTCAADEQGAAVCTCDPAYVGEGCAECAEGHVEYPPDSGDCIADPCPNLDCGHGTCGLGDDGSAVCTCQTGYTGSTCAQCASGYTPDPADSTACVTQLCTIMTCSSHGTCEMLSATETRCVCNTGYDGPACDQCATGYVADPINSALCFPNLCTSATCSGHGTCSMPSEGVTSCDCAEGYEGDTCAQCAFGFVPDPMNSGACIADQCTSSSCSGHGTCSMASAGNTQCACSTGYTGASCDACATDYVIDPNDSTRCIENVCEASTCSGHGTCSMASAGNTQCSCNTGYTGTACSECASGYVIDPVDSSACVANECTASTCSGHGTCEMTGTGARCTCETGYTSAACDQCDSGYTADPANAGACIADSCTASTCSGHGTCSMASAGVTQCACSTGYTGSSCADCASGFVADPTSAGSCIADQCNAASCSGHGTCSMASAGVTSCACEAGYAGQTCAACDSGYVADPTSSTGACIEDACTASTCSGHGTCTMASADTTSCACTTGYTGATCSSCASGYANDPTHPGTCIPNTCTASTCSGHGTCAMASEGVTACTCTLGYAGTDCGDCTSGWTADPADSTACIPDICTPATCSGHGDCSMASAGNVQCTCDTGYAGTNCTSCDSGYVADPTSAGTCIQNICTAASCSGHGQCSMVSAGVTSCACDQGYTGTACAACAQNYVEFPASSGTCIADPCAGVNCALADECNAAGTALIEYSGACVVLGAGSYECASTETACATGSCADGACETFAAPVVGDLAITELMIEPSVTPVAGGQWIEIENSGSHTVDLAGVVVDVNGTKISLPATPIVLRAGERLVFGANADTATNGNVAIDFVLAGMPALDKALGYVDLYLSNGTTQLDSVIWDDTWNHKAGKSLTLSPAATDPVNENDVAESWCFAQAASGSPGAENAPCEVNWCNVQSPASVTFAASTTSAAIFGQVFEAGLTEGNNPSPFIKAQLGWGADGVSPNATWNWVDASYNPGFDTGSNNEEFMASLSIPAQGSYDYAFRMSLDGGLSWKLCDANGSDDGYASANAGDAQVTAPPAAKVIFSEYVEGSSNDKAIEIFNADATPVLLSRCTIRLFANGASAASNTQVLPAQTLAAGGAFVLCNSSSSAGLVAKCDLKSSVANFNGDDALQLSCDGVVLDTFGQIGTDPGTEWAANGVSTVDQTLRRKCGIVQGDVDGSDSFDPSVEWDSFPIGTIDGLQAHDPTCTDPCLNIDCSGNGTCQSSGRDYTCTCDAGFDPATDCANCAAGFVTNPADSTACIADLCTASDCSGHGTCSMASEGVKSCACATGYTGGDCSTCATNYVADPTNSGACILNTCTAATCSDNGTCSMVSAGVTSCLCDPGYAGTACDACDSGYAALPVTPLACVDDPCVPELCNSHGTCTMLADGSGQCACATGYTGTHCESCASGYTLVNGECVDNACDPNPCANGGTCTLVNGTASCSCATGYAGTLCDACATDYVLEGGACIHTKMVSCRDVAPAHASSTVVDVEVTYTSGIGWSQAAACAWTCDTDYALEGGACINSKEVPCVDNAPANATSTSALVTITYTTAENWTLPASCAWTCNSGFHVEGSSCVANVDLSSAWCNVQWPTSYSATTGASTTVYGQIWTALTESTQGRTPGIQAMLCFSSSAIAYPVDFAALSCIDATFNAEKGNNDEYQADLVFNATGTYNYVYAFSGDGAATWTVCDVGGVANDPVEPGVAAIGAVTPGSQIAAVRATADGAGLSLPIDGALVTYLKPALGADVAGFFVQADATGPAVFVAVDPATLSPAPAVGDSVSFTVNEVATVSGVKQVKAIVGFARNSSGNSVQGLVQDLSVATDVVSALDSYEAELISMTGMIAGAFGGAGSGHSSALFETDGVMGSADLKLRLPTSLVTDLELGAGCIVTVDGHMWRFNAQAQPSAYTAAELEAVCDAPKVIGAVANSATQVTVTFDRTIDSASVLANGSQFTFDGGLIASAAVASGKSVTVTTSAQTSAEVYIVTVASTVTDKLGAGVDTDFASEIFEGYTASVTPGTLFFSEYVEGSSNNKAFEIYNATGATKDLAGCEVRLYTNGAATTNTKLALSGTLAPGATLVVCNTGFSAAINAGRCNIQNSTITGFNGDDALELSCGGNTVDVIGQIGLDPGSEWGSGLVSTADNTIRRKCTVNSGDTNGSDAFDPAMEWDGFATDTSDGLGSHCQ